MIQDPKAFFDVLRSSDLFRGSLEQQQVDGLNILTTAADGLPLEYVAYILATVYHETDTTMQPITEYGDRHYFDKYDTGKLAERLGNTPEADGDGYLYRGRGYIQLTGRRNYRFAGTKLGIDLINNPDRALDPNIAATIAVRGMVEGWFTGKKLSDYLPDDYLYARRVVNGMDHASVIRQYARIFERALEAGKYIPTGVSGSKHRPDLGKLVIALILNLIDAILQIIGVRK